jgi:hypothetical protein
MNLSELHQRAKALPDPDADNGMLVHDRWLLWQREMRRHLIEDDPALLFSWPAIYHNMLINHNTELVGAELEELKQHQELLPEPWQTLVEMPHFGSPPDYWRDTPYSANLIHQTYWMMLLLRLGEKPSGLFKPGRTIVEFGGGYGALALLFDRCGFRGDYWIYDLPDMCLLQKYYLSQNLRGRDFRCHWATKIEDLPASADFLLSMSGLDEVPYELREQVLTRVRADSFLTAAWPHAWEYDNDEWFAHNLERFGYAAPDIRMPISLSDMLVVTTTRRPE